MQRSYLAKNQPARRPATGGTSAPRTAGPRQPSGSGGTSAPAGAARGQKYGLGTGQTRGGIGPGRAVGTAPIGVPGPGAPAGREPTPWDSAYEAQVSGANRNYLGQNANLDLAQTSVEQEFGLAPAYSDVKSNPNSRAALLEQHFNEGNRGVMNNANLQLYSGSTGNRLNQNRQGYAQDRDSLAKAYRDALQEIQDKRLEAAEEKGNTETEAGWNRVSHAEEAPLDPTQAPVPRKRKPAQKKAPPKQAVAPARAVSQPKKGKK